MKRAKSVTLIATGLIVGLLPVWTVVEGRTSASNDSGQGSFASAQTSRAERAEERRQRAAERREQAMAAQREELRQMRSERQILLHPEPSWRGSVSGLTPNFYPSDRSLSIDGDFNLGPNSNISKGGYPWLWSDDAGNLATGFQALGSTTTGSRNTAVGYYALYGTTEGYDNAALGYLALVDNEIGNWNVAVGSRALTNNSDGGYNVALGSFALSSNTTGTDNTAVGNTALMSTDGASTYLYGSFNTAVGSGSLVSNTSGSFNVALGFNALFSNTDAGLLTAVGRNALASNTTVAGPVYTYRGIGNSALGSDALQANTTGFFNTATGSNALRYNKTGYENTATGYSALKNNTDVTDIQTYRGVQNSAFGSFALLSNTTGSANAAVGSQALYSNSIGNNNTAVGAFSLYSNQTGSRNTAVGWSALQANMAGQYNTALGYYALKSSTGSFNIAVGSDAGNVYPPVGGSNILIGNGGSSGESNTIRIGVQASGMPDDGQHNRAFLAGVYDTVIAGKPVCVDSSAQLGECPPPGLLSSRRFKREIRNMGGASEKLAELRPVTFRFKKEFERGSPGLQFGLIAEEVAEVFPQLVEYDDEGKPYTVRYELLTPLLLNELQNQQRLVRAQGVEIARLRDETRLVAEQGRQLAHLRARLDRLEAAEARVSESRGSASSAETAFLPAARRAPPG